MGKRSSAEPRGCGRGYLDGGDTSPVPGEGPFSSSHSWTTTEMRLPPALGGGCQAPSEENGELVRYQLLIFYFILFWL